MTRPGAADPAHPLGTKSTATGAAYKDDPHLARYWGENTTHIAYVQENGEVYLPEFGWVLRVHTKEEQR